MVNLTVIVLFPLQHLKEKHHSIFIQFITVWQVYDIFVLSSQIFCFVFKNYIVGSSTEQKAFLFVSESSLFIFQVKFSVFKSINS